MRIIAVSLMVLTAFYATYARAQVDHQTIVIGSKNFMENRLLAEIFAQLLEARTGASVIRHFGLAGTQVCFEALRTGAIDLYPEYTGTGLVTILGQPPSSNARHTLNTVRTEFLERWRLVWLSPLGFENSYALALPRARAQALDITTLSDLARVSATMTAGFGYEFAQRPDGLPGLRTAYGLTFQQVITMQQTLKYQAAGAGDVDVLDVYTTDGRLARYDFTILEDDLDFFPPYEAAALIRQKTLDRLPAAAPALSLLTNALDAATMRALNLRVQEGRESIPAVAHDALRTLHLVRDPHDSPSAPSRQPSTPNLLTYLWEHRAALLDHLQRHIALSGSALILGVALALPLGMWLQRYPPIAEPVIRAVGMTQTVPSIALLAFMIPLFGVGIVPAIVALWIYSMFPILRNTYSGLRDAAPSAVDAATALGMDESQVLRWVRLPLAAPFIMAGIRTSAVITVGTATLAAFIGAGGLGVPIVSGLQLADTALILSGALPAAILALFVDSVLGRVERWIRPRGVE